MPVTLEDLIAADHETACEYPPGFEYDRELERVQKVRPGLEAITGVPFELDCSVQDASFFAELATRRPLRDQPRTYVTSLGIRFSCFGNFVAIWVDDDDAGERRFIEPVADALERAGFRCVPLSLLEEPYSGPNKFLQGLGSWWLRYFDYL